jgi:hypothetical protein
MKLPSISNGQAQVLMGLTAISVVFFIYYKSKDTIKEAANDVKVALDPTDAKNLASRGARAVLGEDFVIDKIGGSVAGVVDFFSVKPVTAAKTTKSQTTTPTTKKGTATNTVGIFKASPTAAKDTKKQVDGFWSGLGL